MCDLTIPDHIICKNCPYCGSGIDNKPHIPWPANRQGTWYTAQCGNPACGAMVEGKTIEETAARWNRRVIENEIVSSPSTTMKNDKDD